MDFQFVQSDSMRIVEMRDPIARALNAAMGVANRNLRNTDAPLMEAKRAANRNVIDEALMRARTAADRAHAANRDPAMDLVAPIGLPQRASDTSFKLPSADSLFTGYSPPGPQDDSQGLTRADATPSEPAAELKFNTPKAVGHDFAAALKNESWNNLMMSSITTVGYAGAAYGIDSFLSPSTSVKTGTESKKEAKEAVELAKSALEDAKADRKNAEVKKEAATEEKKAKAEERVTEAEKTEVWAEERVETAEKKYEALSGKSLIKTSSKKGSILVNGISQLGISMGVRTAATLASATSDAFRKSVKYITPFVSGSLRGAVDYLALGKGTWRTITNSIVVTGLEYLSTAVVVGYD